MPAKWTSFAYRSISFEPRKKRIRFFYELRTKRKRPLQFVEMVELPRIPNLNGVPKELLKKVLESVHVMLGISYYKLYCPKKLGLPYALSQEEAQFWSTVYQKGLGEFAYQNKLDPRKFAAFPFKKGLRVESFACPRKNRSLLGIGGGKDSIVAGELLKEGGHVFDAFLVETERPSPVVNSVIKTMGVGCVVLKRKLDPKVFVPQEGAYNGHVPISAVFAFLGLLAAVLYDYRHVIVANEHSSNFGNLRYKGMEINHQWSKSVEFESMLQSYTRRFLSPDLCYFSLLRPFYEIRVVEMFTRYPQYFSLFTSCNRSFTIRTGRDPGWCGECAKCVFVFTLLSAYLSPAVLLKIFGKNLYANPKLKTLFQDLLGKGGMKPFDCVGTFEEMQEAYARARGRRKWTHVYQTVPAPTVPVPFRFAGMKTALILGYGKEGRTNEEFLKKKFPKLLLAHADQSTDARYLQKQEDFDVVIKTPSIPKSKVIRPYTTASNLFFEAIRERGNLVIGVTGSKGKSTTASLIAHVLKTGGVSVKFLGNIGKPMLSALLRSISKKDVFVLELSSYQLEDLEYSPDIAVLTNLFPEHMNHHGGLEAYYKAKERITRFQNEGDYFVYNPRVPLLKTWKTRAQKLPYVVQLPLERSEIPLLGEHNRDNVRAAVTVAWLLGIPEAKIKKAVHSFKPLPHRLEFVGRFKKIDFYDDAISTTPESTIMALKALKNVDTIFLGGEDRGYDFTELERALRVQKVRNVVLFPETGPRILSSTKGFHILETRQMKEAVRFAYQATAPGKICLLSTASPSYSLWANFEEKGGVFQKWVKKLA